MRKLFSSFAKFIPVIVILAVGMTAVHISVKLSSEHAMLEQKYELLSERYTGMTGIEDVLGDRSVENLNQHIRAYENQLYWVILALNLIAFLLLLLNADKMRRLERVNLEKHEALKLLEHRLAAIEASVEGIGIVDAKGNLTYMNTALKNLHGIQEGRIDDFIGKSWLNLYTEKGRKQVSEEVMPEFLEKGYWFGKNKILGHDDKVIDVEMSLTLLKDGGFIGTARDISEQERINAEKKAMQDQLSQAQKMEAIGRLAGGIAHDFNNILAAMNGYAEFLTEDLEKDSQPQKYARNILQAGHQARALVDKILTFSRRHENAIEVVGFSAPLRESLSMLEATLPKTIEVKRDINFPEAKIDGNTIQITQMIMNLCVNAKDAMEDERGELCVGLSHCDPAKDVPIAMVSNELPDPEASPLIRVEEGGEGQTLLYMGTVAHDREYVRLSVSDTGSGMNRAIIDHVFEPFFTTKDEHKGTGLGLATVHGTVRSHRGALILDTTMGKGTRFDVLFPVSQKASEEQSAEEEAGIVSHSGTVLMVDDQEEVLEMTATMLIRLGYDVETAKDGLEALDKLREEPGKFDLVLTDHNMPKMTGAELVEEAHLDFPDLPFVLLSGYSKKKLEELMKEHTAIRATLRKPISQKKLGKTLAEVLQERVEPKAVAGG